MRTKVVLILTLVIGLIPFVPELLIAQKGRSAGGAVHVRGYFRKDGTYVSPHVRSYPDGIPYNNYSFPGNYNPNTGKIAGGYPLKYLERYYRNKLSVF